MDSGAAAIADKVGSKGTAAGAEVFNDYENNEAGGECSHAEGYGTEASGTNSHAEGSGTEASGANSHAEGYDTVADRTASHAEGYLTHANGEYSHTEGCQTGASGESAHAEGYLTMAKGGLSHAEGHETTAQGAISHAEGKSTLAGGDCSHAEGSNTSASGRGSHAEGFSTQATNNYEHAEGSYNASHTGTRHSIGIGTSTNARKNAVEVMDDGRVFVHGVGGYDGTNPGTAKTLQEAVQTSGKYDEPLIIRLSYSAKNGFAINTSRPLRPDERPIFFMRKKAKRSVTKYVGEDSGTGYAHSYSARDKRYARQAWIRNEGNDTLHGGVLQKRTDFRDDTQWVPDDNEIIYVFKRKSTGKRVLPHELLELYIRERDRTDEQIFLITGHGSRQLRATIGGTERAFSSLRFAVGILRCEKDTWGDADTPSVIHRSKLVSNLERFDLTISTSVWKGTYADFSDMSKVVSARII